MRFRRHGRERIVALDGNGIARTIKMLWGERRGQGTIVADTTDGVPHAACERPEQVPRSRGAGLHYHCRHRDEAVELARRGDRSGDRTTAAEEARAG